MGSFKYWDFLCISAQKCGVIFLLCILIFSDASTFFQFPIFPEAEAAQVQIDSTTSTTQTEQMFAGTQSVFISDQVGYKVYVDSGGQCVYSKTTNGGTSWAAAVQVDSQTDCFGISIWYDQWTPGDTGTSIHILTHDTNPDDLWYNRLDTDTDTLLLGSSPVSVVLGQNALTISSTGNQGSITKGTDGTLYIGIQDSATDQFVVECSSGCDIFSNWTETGTNPFDSANDFNLLMPLPDGDILLINRDLSAEDIRSKVWDDSVGSWSASWVTIDASAFDNTLYDPGMAAAVNAETGDVYLAYIDGATAGTAGIGGNNDDIRTAVYSSGGWVAGADVVTDSALGLTNVAIGIDANNGEVYVAYSGRVTPATLATANVYWATSTSAVSSWSIATGPVNTTQDDIYGVDVNVYNDERIYVSWYGDTSADVFGDTVADITPTIVVSVADTQVAEVRASTTNFYIGGTFAITEKVSSRNVTDITISENGTVDGSTGIENVKLFYDVDTSAPYDCASESYSGGESQFGSTDTNGFSGADGTSAFSSSVTISTTTAMCVYVVLDVRKAADDGSTLDVYIANPATDVLVSGGITAVPTASQIISGNTTIVDSNLTQTHYHWRNDNNTETLATSRTGGNQDTALTAVQQNTPRRLRLGISNEGSTTSLPVALQLEYALNPSTCDLATGWVDVGATDDDWNMYDSTYIVDGTDATDIANAIGGVDNENSLLLTPNGGLRDTSSITGTLTFLTTNWTELEYSIVASTTATEGNTYCFRVTNAGSPLPTYTNYPRATIAADVRVSTLGVQTASVDIPTTDFYVGGAFVVTENSDARDVTSLTIQEIGTIDGTVGVENIRLYYDLDTSAPYNCISESYSGSEPIFGTTDTDGFNAANGVSVFTDTVGISTTSVLCLYPVMDITEDARNGETLDIIISSGSSDVVVSGGSVSPSTALDITGSTTLAGAVVTQTHYHWRSDNGSETTASSATSGTEDVAVTEFSKSSPIRLRIGLSNGGSTTSIPRRYKLEYGIKSTTCEDVSVWSDTDGGGISWSMYDSPNLTNGETTTDIPISDGGVSDPVSKSFLSSNGGVRDTESRSATTTLTASQYVDLEYAITSTADTPYETTFCFRVTQDEIPLLQYDQYAEITTSPKRDYKVQRGSTIVTGTSATIVASPTTYTAPSASSTAFVRITNMFSTGAGRSTAGNTQNADDVTAYISNPENITTSFTINRPTTALTNTRVDWEIIEFIGGAGTDNEMIVRDQRTVTLGATDTTATGTIVSSVVDDSDVVVYITGVRNNSAASSLYYAGQITSRWDAATQQPVFERIGTGAIVDVSYAVVEYSGLNWKVQRVEHQYMSTSTEVEAISVVTSLNQTFLHTQKRMGALPQQVHFGHEVWLSSMGFVSFTLVSSAATSSGQVSVAWVIENTQTSNGAMVVQRGNGIITAGTEPRTTVLGITEVEAMNNTSVFSMSALGQITASNNYPRVLGAVTLTSNNTYEIWNSDRLASDSFYYRTEIVEWPAADLAVRQNYYRFFDDNDALTPADVWPSGAADLGENTSIASLDEPLADGDRVRLRITTKISNATLPAGLLTLKLQYGIRATTCSAIDTWTDVGAVGSGEIWRGYNTSVTNGVSLSSDPPSGGDLLISVADVAGRFVEQNPATANEFSAADGEDVEYDWVLEQNGASQRTTYCFRMIKTDETTLDGYIHYPQIRTEGYTPATQNWRWYDDETNETPVVDLADENVAPIDVKKGNAVLLRIAIAEIKNLSQPNARFKLQFSESPTFTSVNDVVAIGDCVDDSIWCYADSVSADNATITTALLSDSGPCVASVGSGCGVHNESSDQLNNFVHEAGSVIENEFSIQYTNVQRKFGQVYYFRVYDIVNDQAVPVNTGETYPSLVGESASMTFALAGVTSGATTEGITTDVATTPVSIPFGSVPFDTQYEAAYRLTVDTNGTEGYRMYMFATQDMLDSYGNKIESIAGTNIAPVPWTTGCPGTAAGCVGYHVGDDALAGGSTRFSPDDSYAAFSTTTPEEVMFSSQPTTNETTDIIFKIQVTEQQPAGEYQKNVVFVSVPVF